MNFFKKRLHAPLPISNLKLLFSKNFTFQRNFRSSNGIFAAPLKVARLFEDSDQVSSLLVTREGASR